MMVSKILLLAAFLLLISSPLSHAAVTMESAVANALGITLRTFPNFTDPTVIEVAACRDDPVKANMSCLQMAPMSSAKDIGFARTVFTHSDYTAPNVEALIGGLRGSSISNTTTQLIYHRDPFVEDNTTAGFPVPSGFTLATGVEVMQSLIKSYTNGTGDTSFITVSFRRPLHPCASEDLFQFTLNSDPSGLPGKGFIYSVGVASGRLCRGFITNPVDLKFCKAPENQPQCL